MNIKKTKLGPSEWQVYLSDVNPANNEAVVTSGKVFKFESMWYVRKYDKQRGFKNMGDAIKQLEREHKRKLKLESGQPLTDAERKAAQRARNREMGLIEFSIVVPDTPEAKQKVREYCAKLTKQHLK